MRQRTPLPIRSALALAATTVLTLAACSDDSGGGGGSGGGGSTEAFCEQIEALAGSTEETTEEQDIASFRALAEAAPSEISDEMNDLVEIFEQLQAFDLEAAADDEMEDFFALASDLEDTSAEIEDFAVENCPDLPGDLFDSE
jgi:hypothetical protein